MPGWGRCRGFGGVSGRHRTRRRCLHSNAANAGLGPGLEKSPLPGSACAAPCRVKKGAKKRVGCAKTAEPIDTTDNLATLEVEGNAVLDGMRVLTLSRTRLSFQKLSEGEGAGVAGPDLVWQQASRRGSRSVATEFTQGCGISCGAMEWGGGSRARLVWPTWRRSKTHV